MNLKDNQKLDRRMSSSLAPKVMPAVEIIDLNKWFGSLHVLREINFVVNEGEKIVIIGPSGSGKSTLIRCINGLEDFQTGSLKVRNIPVNQSEKRLDQIRKNVGMVFQSFNLFPHLTVLENCTLAPIWVNKLTRKNAEALAMSYLDKVHIADQAQKYPGQLSGGQQQRVAIARALAMHPKIMLFDEPTSALDPEMIKEVLDVIVALADSGMTMICVTHEMGFAQQIADRIVFMDEGQIVENSEANSFFAHPRHERSKKFLQQIL